MKNKHLIKLGLAVLLVPVTISSCKVSKDIKTPDTKLPIAYRYEQKDTTNMAKLPWASFFQDQQLKVLIDSAVLRNNDLQLAIKDIEAAELVLRQAKLGNLPTVGLQATATTNRPSDNSLNGFQLNQFLNQNHVEDYTAAAYLSWEADLWGKIKSQKSAALAAYLGTAEARKAVQTRIVNDVAKGYYNLLMLDKQLQIARKNTLLNDSTLKIIELQFRAGQVTSLAVQQATAQKLTAQGLIPKFEQEIVIQENALSVLAGTIPSAINRSADLDTEPVPPFSGAGVPADLLSLRPDVKLAELALSEANGKVGYAKAATYPSLTITAQGGLNAFKESNWLTIPASLFGTVAGGLIQPLFQQKQLKTAYEIAKVRREQTVIRFRQSVLVAVGDVTDNLAKVEKLQQQQNYAIQRVFQLNQATSNSRQLFSNGLANYLEVITAQSSALQEELELAGIMKAVLDAQVDLYRSVGGGWN